MFRRSGIRSRLFTLLAVPTAALIALSTFGVLGATGVVRDSAALQQSIAQLDVAAGLIEALQVERRDSVLYVRSGRQSGGEAVQAAREWTDRQLAALGSDADGARALPVALRDLLADDRGLASHRARILGPDETGLTDGQVTSRYDRMIDGLIDAAAQLDGGDSGDIVTAGSIDAWAALERFSELTWRERTLMTAVLQDRGMTTAERLAFAENRGAAEAELDRFRRQAPPAAVSRVEEYLDAPQTEAADTIRRLVFELRAIGAEPLPFEVDEYDRSLEWELAQLSVVSEQLRSTLFERVADLRSDAEREQAVFAGVAAVAVLLGLLLALVTTRSLVRPLRHLDRSARQVRERLPAAVQRLSQPDATVDVDDLLPPGTRAGDLVSTPELERLGQALDDVGAVAVEVATDQARLRAGVSEMFTNFARRNQRLLDRQLTLIDALEADEDDAERLGELFSLDHLATRMRRNAESLLVLAGDESQGASGPPMAVSDVVRAAMSEIEDYQRVEVVADTAALVAGRAAPSLAHLLAELLENATVFSPPHQPVAVSLARSDDGGVRLTITDRGIGMSPEEVADANERIANQPLIDAAVSRMLGFYVVGRLAHRLGAHVQLSSPPTGGIRATVLVPASLVADEGAGEWAGHAGRGARGDAPAPVSGSQAGVSAAPAATAGPSASGAPAPTAAASPVSAGNLSSFANARQRAQRDERGGDERTAVTSPAAPPVRETSGRARARTGSPFSDLDDPASRGPDVRTRPVQSGTTPGGGIPGAPAPGAGAPGADLGSAGAPEADAPGVDARSDGAPTSHALATGLPRRHPTGKVPGGEVAGPGRSHAEVSGTEAPAPKVPDPEVRDSRVPDPEVRDPEVPGPEVSGPEVAAREVAAPEVAAPEVGDPEVLVPVASGVDASSPAVPGTDDTGTQDAGPVAEAPTRPGTAARTGITARGDGAPPVTVEPAPLPSRRQSSTGVNPLPPRTPRRVPSAPQQQPSQALRPLSPDTIASTLASLQTAWRQVNEAGADPAGPQPERPRPTPPGADAGAPGTGRAGRAAAPGPSSTARGGDGAAGEPWTPTAGQPGRRGQPAPSEGRPPMPGTPGPPAGTGSSRGPQRTAAGGDVTDGASQPASGDEPIGHSSRPRRRPRRSTTPSWSTPWHEKEEGR